MGLLKEMSQCPISSTLKTSLILPKDIIHTNSEFAEKVYEGMYVCVVNHEYGTKSVYARKPIRILQVKHVAWPGRIRLMGIGGDGRRKHELHSVDGECILDVFSCIALTLDDQYIAVRKINEYIEMHEDVRKEIDEDRELLETL